jgi:hypothetical protein
MGELVEILLGADSYQSYIASQILGLLGFIAMSIVNYDYRDDKSIPWSFNKWWTENWPLLILLVIAMYVGLRWQSDIVDGINSSTNELSFIKDKWFWFIIGGFLFRAIIHQANKLVKKLTAKDLVK